MALMLYISACNLYFTHFHHNILKIRHVLSILVIECFCAPEGMWLTVMITFEKLKAVEESQGLLGSYLNLQNYVVYDAFIL